MPARIQAELVAKLQSYDRGFRKRAGPKVLVAIVVKTSDVDSERAGAQIKAAFQELESIGGLPHEEIMVPWRGAPALAATCAEKHWAIIYLSTGLSDDIQTIAKELSGKDVLSVGSVPSDVPKGAVLGFDLVSGRTKLALNLSQAKRQNITLAASVLSLMRIVQ